MLGRSAARVFVVGASELLSRVTGADTVSGLAEVHAAAGAVASSQHRALAAWAAVAAVGGASVVEFAAAVTVRGTGTLERAGHLASSPFNLRTVSVPAAS